MRPLLVTVSLAVLLAFGICAEASAADAVSPARRDEIRRELLDQKHVLEMSLVHGGEYGGARYYLAECEFALGHYADAADHYARALLSETSDEQRLKCRAALDRLGRMGVWSRFDPSPPNSLATGRSLTSPAGKSVGRIQNHHDALADQLKKHADRAVEQKQMYFNRAIADIEHKLQDDIRHLPKSYTDGRQKITSDNSGEVSEMTRIARDRQVKLRYQLQKSVEGIQRETERKLDNLKYSANSLEDQTRSTSGAVGLVPAGTSMHVRNYINFPDASESDRYAPPTVPVRATPGKWSSQSPRAVQPMNKPKGK